MQFRSLILNLLVAATLTNKTWALGKLWSDVKPTSFKEGDNVDIHVGQLFSLVIGGALPYDFYSVRWCDSVKGHQYDSTILAQNKTVSEDEINERVHESPYSYKVGKSTGVEVLCNRILTKEELDTFAKMILDLYRYQLFIDGLPSAAMTKDETSGKLEANYKEGIYMGDFDYRNGKIWIFNHLSITVKTHKVTQGEELRIVGFEVEPRSIDREDIGIENLDHARPQYIKLGWSEYPDDLDTGILFSYSIKTVMDETTTWQSRMDHYYAIGKHDVHLWQILVSFGIMLVTSTLACTYVKVSVSRDFALLQGGLTSRTQRRVTRLQNHHQRIPQQEGMVLTGGFEIMSDATEQVGWQRIKEDVFRAPKESTVLAVCTGIGAQIVASVYLGLGLMCIFYSYAPLRPFIYTTGHFSLALCGFLNGFVTSRTLKFFKSTDWKMCAFLAAVIFPMYILVTFSIGDIIESAMGSSAAVPLSEGLLHYLIWWALDAPVAVYGSYRGTMTPLAIVPDVSPVRKAIPQLPWYLKRWAIMGLYGPIIFATIIYEFEQIMQSIWRSFMIYGMFFFLFITLVLMGITIAALSIVVTYKSLCHQNYDWWWNSFCLGASGGIYMFLYSIYYLYINEEYNLLSGDFIYFLSMSLISSCFAMMCGSISILASYLFVERIYNTCSKGEFTKF